MNISKLTCDIILRSHAKKLLKTYSNRISFPTAFFYYLLFIFSLHYQKSADMPYLAKAAV